MGSIRDVMVALGSKVDNFSAFEIGAIHYMESRKEDSNPYEPGFTEYDRFTEGWGAARDNQLADVLPSLQYRYQAALRSQ